MRKSLSTQIKSGAKVALITCLTLVATVACGPGFSPKKAKPVEGVRVAGQPDPSGSEMMIRSVTKADIREVVGSSYELSFTLYDGERAVPVLSTYHYGGTSDFTATTTVADRYHYTVTAMCAPADCSEVVALVSREDKKTAERRQNSFLIQESPEYGMQLVEAQLGTSYLDPHQAWTMLTGNFD